MIYHVAQDCFPSGQIDSEDAKSTSHRCQIVHTIITIIISTLHCLHHVYTYVMLADNVHSHYCSYCRNIPLFVMFPSFPCANI